MLLSNLENKVLFIMLALVLVIALIVIASQILDIPHLSALTTNIYEIAGEANCSGCITSG